MFVVVAIIIYGKEVTKASTYNDYMMLTPCKGAISIRKQRIAIAIVNYSYIELWKPSYISYIYHLAS